MNTTTPFDLAVKPVTLNGTEVMYDEEKQVRFNSIDILMNASGTSCGTNSTGNPDTLYGDD